MSRLTALLLIGAGWCAAQPVAQDPQQRLYGEQLLASQLQQNPNNVLLLLKMGAMKLAGAGAVRDGDARTAALDEAQSCYERVLAIDSSNVAALYSLGVLGWTRVFPELRTARAQSAMEPETPGPLRDRAARAILNARYSRTISDSIAYLERVLAIDPQNNDSMAYLNLLFRSKADLEETPHAAAEDSATADQWVRKALETARSKPPSAGSSMPPPPQPPLSGPDSPARIRVGANVQAVNLIRKVDPVYPELAEKARIQGTVRFNAIIAKDGTLINLQVVSGHPMLVQSALEAVRQWLYKPTLLNNQPVEVITTIDVDFALPSQ